jgi:hypothetical protein
MEIFIFLFILIVINAFVEAYIKKQNNKNEKNDKSE